MPSLDPRLSNHHGQRILSLALTAAAFLLIGFIIKDGQWGDRGSWAEPAQINALQQARDDLRDGNYDVAIQEFKVLAGQGNARAQYWSGYMTDIGLGTKRDPQRAIALYKQAADKKVVAAELHLGELYLEGNQILPDTSLAKTYLERAAYQGNPRAAFLLGGMYRDGVGMPPDPIRAYAWSEVATVEGSRFAKQERDASLHSLKAQDQETAVDRTKDILSEIKKGTPPKSLALGNADTSAHQAQLPKSPVPAATSPS